MGNARSVPTEEPDIWWRNISTSATVPRMECPSESNNISIENEREETSDVNEKREQRKQILAAKRIEVQTLRVELEKYVRENEELRKLLETNKSPQAEKQELDNPCKGCVNHQNKIDALTEENERFKEEIESLQSSLEQLEATKQKNRELMILVVDVQAELQKLNTEFLTIEKERTEYQKHIVALKDVIKLTKEMVHIREDQIKDLNSKIKTIEELLASKEMKIMSDDLREEYERQLLNIRNLRTLYEVRQRVDKRDREQLEATLAEQKALLEAEQAKVTTLQTTTEEQQQELSTKSDKISSLESNLGLSKAECRDLQSEINVINQLFSQILVGCNNSQNVDLDKLTKHLEENHDLLTKIVDNEQCPESSASLSKVLLDLINQTEDFQNAVDNVSDHLEELSTETGEESDVLKRQTTLESIPEECESHTNSHQLNSAAEIVENLPKVWKVLIELLSQQNPPCDIAEGNSSMENSCYKSVQTPNGPKLVLSVSQTFIRLKDLILEKKSLEKEMSRLKNLNGHLEGRLHDQEKRLQLVSGELSKTWHVVGKMQKQHQQLHTQERILRYELAHKRKMLTELKHELEYCREKWVQAREKNSVTETQWKQLRSEFAARKVKPINVSSNNSGESGYSDDKSSSDEEGSNKTKSSDENQCDVDALRKETKNSEEKEIESNLLVNKVNEEELLEGHNTDLGEGSTTSNSTITEVENKKSLESRILSSEDNIQKNTILVNNDQETACSSNDNTRISSFTDKTKTDINETTYLSNTSIDTTALKCSSANLEQSKTSIIKDVSSITDIEISSQSLNDQLSPKVSQDDLATFSMNEQQSDQSIENSPPIDIRTTETSEKSSITVQQPGSSKTTDSISIIESQPGPSNISGRSLEDILSKREARLKRMEEQCRNLVTKVTKTSERSHKISDKLDNLHGIYGEGGTNARRSNEGKEESQLDNGQHIISVENIIETIEPSSDLTIQAIEGHTTESNNISEENVSLSIEESSTELQSNVPNSTTE